MTDHGTQYFNAAGCSSSTTAVFRNVTSGGRPVRSLEELGARIRFTENIRFE